MRIASAVKLGAAPVLGGEPAEEVLGEQRDVLAALAQRRDPHLDHVEPVVEVLAEGAARDLGLEIAVGRGDHADVDLDLLGARRPA